MIKWRCAVSVQETLWWEEGFNTIEEAPMSEYDGSRSSGSICTGNGR